MKNYKEFLINLLCDIVASFIMAIGIYCFLEQADIAPGGISGVAIMLKYSTDSFSMEILRPYVYEKDTSNLSY